MCALDVLCSNKAGCCELCGGEHMLAQSAKANDPTKEAHLAFVGKKLPKGYGKCQIKGTAAACKLRCRPTTGQHLRITAKVAIVYGSLVLRVHKIAGHGR